MQKNNEDRLRPPVEIALAILDAKYTKFLAGEITKSEAITQAANIINDVRYG